jgi:hypothetical protein
MEFAIVFKKKLILYSINKENNNEMLNEWRADDIFALELYEQYDENEIKKKYNLDIFEMNKCICGNQIVNHCVIEHKQTKKRICVGNHCVRHIDKETHEQNTNILNNVSDIKNKKIFTKPTIKTLQKALIDKVITNQEYDNISIIKNVRRKNKIILKLNQIEQILKINEKIANYYCQKHIDLSSKNKILIVVNQSNNTDLICEYYEKYEKSNPSDENNNYTLEYIDEPKWILTEKKIKGNNCNDNNFYTISHIFNNCQITQIKNAEKLLYDFSCDNLCSNCFKNESDPSDSNNKYILILNNGILSWNLFETTMVCDECDENIIIKYDNIYENILECAAVSDGMVQLDTFILDNDDMCICRNCYNEWYSLSTNKNMYVLLFYNDDKNLYYKRKLMETRRKCIECETKFMSPIECTITLCSDCFETQKCHKCYNKNERTNYTWYSYGKIKFHVRHVGKRKII